jgi:NAD(P)-dependent dehydrogenase (short-subunit alcohol dehydrogenase family)
MAQATPTTQVAVVTGAARGIGRGIAEALARKGIAVALLDIDGNTAKAASLSIEESGGRARAFECDVRDRQAVIETFENVSKSVGPPNILVNNAGIYKSSDLVGVDPNDWINMLQVNLTGAFWCAQAAAPFLIRAPQGRLVNIASTGAKIGWERNHAYCASKSGLLGLTRTLALELAAHGVTVNSICPGNTDTEMMASVDADICADNGWPVGKFAQAMRERIPLGRLATPWDVASLVCFLCSEEAQFITGQAINVDGGLVMY